MNKTISTSLGLAFGVLIYAYFVDGVFAWEKAIFISVVGGIIMYFWERRNAKKN